MAAFNGHITMCQDLEIQKYELRKTEADEVGGTLESNGELNESLKKEIWKV